MDLKTISSLGRFKNIVFIFFKYGFEDLIERFDLPFKATTEKIHPNDMGTYERIRRALEELGPTFIKFGQIMSVRPDLLPQPLIRELSKLQDEVAPVGFAAVREVIEKSLGQALEKTFPIFEKEPIAAASLSQVHRAAVGKAGPVVAVKVQRPGVRAKIRTDLDIMAVIAEQLHERFEELRVYNLPNMVEASKHSLLRELDFTKEARYMKIARTHMMVRAGNHKPEIYIPDVYEAYTNERLLVMEFIQGTRLSELDFSTLDDAETLAKQGMRSGIQQIFEDGFFHADPHPGNILLTETRTLCLIDWGMVGRLTVGDRYELIDLIKAVAEKDGKQLCNAILSIANKDENGINIRNMERELLDVLDLYCALPVKDLNLGHMLTDITYLMQRYHLTLPPNLAIMIKALITLEGIARQLYPKLDVISEAEPYIRHIAAKRYSPKLLWEKMTFSLWQFFSLQEKIPGHLNRIVRKIDDGELNIHFQHENLTDLENTLEVTFNRLTFGIIIGALVIGSSMIITTGVGPLLFGYPALGIIGYLVSGVLGLWLIFNIIRRRRY